MAFFRLFICRSLNRELLGIGRLIAFLCDNRILRGCNRILEITMKKMTEIAEQIGWTPRFIYQLAYYCNQYETFFRKKVLDKYPELTHKHFVVVA